jgi:hypothetical protein
MLHHIRRSWASLVCSPWAVNFQQEKLQHVYFLSCSDPLVNLYNHQRWNEVTISRTHLFHISPKTPAPFDTLWSSKLARWVAVLLFSGPRFCVIMLSNMGLLDWLSISRVDHVEQFFAKAYATTCNVLGGAALGIHRISTVVSRCRVVWEVFFVWLCCI